jgi:hypothetical protein
MMKKLKEDYARFCYLRALKVYEEFDRTGRRNLALSGEAKTLMDMAVNLEHTTAIELCQAPSVGFHSDSVIERIIGVANKVSTSSPLYSRQDRASAYYEEGVSLARKIPNNTDLPQKASGTGNLLISLAAQLDHEEARAYFDRMQAVNNATGIFHGT